MNSFFYQTFAIAFRPAYDWILCFRTVTLNNITMCRKANYLPQYNPEEMHCNFICSLFRILATALLKQYGLITSFCYTINTNNSCNILLFDCQYAFWCLFYHYVLIANFDVFDQVQFLSVICQLFESICPILEPILQKVALSTLEFD